MDSDEELYSALTFLKPCSNVGHSSQHHPTDLRRRSSQHSAGHKGEDMTALTYGPVNRRSEFTSPVYRLVWMFDV